MFVSKGSLKLLPLLVTLVVVSALNFRSYFHRGLPYTHDGENHLARFANYWIAVKEGQFPPRFAPNLVNHYGYPVFNFNYPLANILSLPFSALDASYILTFKIISVSFFVLGLLGVMAWLWLLKQSVTNMTVGLLVYGLTPYIFNTINYRGSIGELMALSLLPWLLVVVEVIKARSALTQLIVTGFVGLITAFLLSHNVTVLFGLPLVLGYALLRLGTETRSWRRLGALWLIAIGLSLWFWVPAVMEKNHVILDRAGLSQEYSRHFVTINQLLFSPLQFGFSFPGSIDSLAFSVGLANTGVLLLAGCWWLGRRLRHLSVPAIMSWLLVITGVLLVLQLSVSRPFWDKLFLVRFIQFPWRLSIFLPLLIAGVAGLSFSYLGRAWQRLLILLLVLQGLVLLNVPDIGLIDKPNLEYELFSQSTTTAHENLPQTFTYINLGDWQPRPLLLSGMADINVLSWTGTQRTYSVNVTSEQALLVEPTMYFLGWQTAVTSAAQPTPLPVSYVLDGESAGRIAYYLDAGTYMVTTRFTQRTPARVVGNSLSLLTGLGFIGWLLYQWGYHRIYVRRQTR